MSEPPAAPNASSIAGHTRSVAMMLAWQETPAPVTWPAYAMQVGPVWAAT